ncbi:unnamed protein product [Effrenium voratum]|nr:unnamed protein product [Effrenium voratum]
MSGRSWCPASDVAGSDTVCSFDEGCACSNSSHVRELVNVSIDGRPCYACEPPRLPACTEASDQCTPEDCECANSLTHVKHNASTVDGALCFYCEPTNGTWSFGRNEAMLGLSALLVVLWISGRRIGRPRSTLRLPRRQGDRKAIRVSQEPLKFHEEVLALLGSVQSRCVVCLPLGEVRVGFPQHAEGVVTVDSVLGHPGH